MKKPRKSLFAFLITLCAFITLSGTSKGDFTTEILAEEPVASEQESASSESDFQIKMIDPMCRFGDSTLIRYKDKHILIDAGGTLASAPLIYDAIKDIKTIDYMIFTHSDADHICNFANINGVAKWFAEGGTVDRFIDFDMKDKMPLFQTVLYIGYKALKTSLIGAGKIKNYHTSLDCINEVNGGKKYFPFDGDAGLRILDNYFYNHDGSGMSKSAKINVLSTCVLINVKNDKYLFTGDLEEYDSVNGQIIDENEPKSYKRIYGETFLVARNYEYLKDGVVFFKAGHHGSYTSNSKTLLDTIRPRYIGISSAITYIGKTDGPVFPHNVSLDNMARWTDFIYITDRFVVNEEGADVVESYYGDIILNLELETGEYQFTSSNLIKQESGGENDKEGKENTPSAPKLMVSSLTDKPFLDSRLNSLYVYFLDEIDQYGNNIAFDFSLINKNIDWTLKYEDIIQLFKDNYTFASKPIKRRFNNATYIKFGHIDILINFGSDTKSSMANNIKKVSKLCNDNVLDYLVISNYSVESSRNLFGENGLLKKSSITKIDNLIHFGLKNFELVPSYLKEMEDLIGDKYLPIENIYTSDNVNGKKINILKNDESGFSLDFDFMNMSFTQSSMPGKVSCENFREYNLQFNVEMTYGTNQRFRYCNLGPLFEGQKALDIYNFNKSKLKDIDVFDMMDFGQVLINSKENTLNFKKFYQYLGNPMLSINGSFESEPQKYMEHISLYKQIFTNCFMMNTAIFNPESDSKNKNQIVAGNNVVRVRQGSQASSKSRIFIFGCDDINVLSDSTSEEYLYSKNILKDKEVGLCYSN